MAEALGESGLTVDRIFRTFGLARKAQKDLEGSTLIRPNVMQIDF